MHSRDPNKPWEEFWREIENILVGTSNYCPNTIHDFSGFVFTQDANFSEATFTQGADFIEAQFTQSANFRWAKFVKNADFSVAHFTQDADFRWATFNKKFDFHETTVGKVLDLRMVSVAAEGEVILHRVNQLNHEQTTAPQAQGSDGQASQTTKNVPAQGLRLRLGTTLLDRFRFEDINWHQQHGRLVLQDELDLEDKNKKQEATHQDDKDERQDVTHELVADAYRRLVNNFERARQYEWAEQAVVGEMEMRRLNPATPRLTRFFLGAYKSLSLYGSSFGRALSWLVVFLLFLFPSLFPAAGLQMREPSSVQTRVSWWEPWGGHTGLRRYGSTYLAGLVATLETATLQRDPGYRPANDWTRLLAAVELVAIPGQLTLFLLALRRRFRR